MPSEWMGSHSIHSHVECREAFDEILIKTTADHSTCIVVEWDGNGILPASDEITLAFIDYKKIQFSCILTMKSRNVPSSSKYRWHSISLSENVEKSHDRR